MCLRSMGQGMLKQARVRKPIAKRLLHGAKLVPDAGESRGHLITELVDQPCRLRRTVSVHQQAHLTQPA